VPLDPLATVTDLEDRLGRALDAVEVVRANALLEDASATVRAYTGQQFGAATSTVRLQVRGGKVRLPQRPVTAVTGIDNMSGAAVEFTWYAGQTISLGTEAINSWELEPIGEQAWVDVTYTHGQADVPADIVGVVCQMVGRALGTPADQTGYSSESIGTYSYSVGAATAAGAAGLMNDERAVLDRYRQPIGSMRVAW
jgi:hypothetical protein